MRRILFVTYGNPELAARGDDVYTWDVINALKHNKDVYLHVVSYYEDNKDRNKGYFKLEALVDKLTYVPFVYKNILVIGFSKYPAKISNRRTKGMIQTVKNILGQEHYDAVVINKFCLSYLIEEIKDYKGRKIFIAHEVEEQLTESTYKYQTNCIKRWAYYADWLKTRYYEKRYLAQFDALTAICDLDKELFGKTLPNMKIDVLPPVIDLSTTGLAINKVENRFIICGTFHWGPKRQNLMMLLASKNIGMFKKSGHELLIVGYANKPDVDYVNSHYEGIQMTGPVESVAPYYEKARIAIVPELAGGGFKLKITEAVRYSKPIVAIKGSVTDKDMLPGKHYIEAVDFDDLIIKAVELMGQPDKQKELVVNARELFNDRYTMEYAASMISQLL